MVELLLVVIMVTIIAIIGAVAYGSFRFQNLMAAAEKVTADLRYAKNLALTTNEWHGAAFQPAPANTYNLYLTDGTNDTVIHDPEDPGRDFYVALSNLYHGITINAVDIGGGQAVEFNPLGVPYTDQNGSVLTANGTITLSDGGTMVTIIIAAETGRIYIQ